MTGIKWVSRSKDTINIYKTLKEKGIIETQIMASIYAKSRDNSRTPMQWDTVRLRGSQVNRG